MKDPAFLFYPNDYIGGTLGFTFEEKGAYIELLMTQFNRGHMTKHMIAQILGQNMDNIWSTISSKFKVDSEGLYYNERLELEQNKRKSYSESRRNNIKGVNQHTKKNKKDAHMTSHMENENRNENIIINEKEKKEEVQLIPAFSDFEIYALIKEPRLNIQSLKLKYESWIANDWKDGNDKKIKNWKSKLLNTIPYLKLDEDKSKPKQKVSLSYEAATYLDRETQLRVISGEITEQWALKQKFPNL